LGGALKVNAQNWAGNAPSNGLEAVLYNVATGWYVNGGYLWGTQLTLSSGGMFFTLSNNTNGGYDISSIGWGDDNAANLYTNGKNGTSHGGYSARFVFELISDNTYKIKCAYKETDKSTTTTWYYLVGAGQNAAVTYTTTEPDNTDLNAQWKLVTYDDMNTWFSQVADAANTSASSADGTYLIKAPNFGSRSDSNLKQWLTSYNGTTSNLYDLSESHKSGYSTYSPANNTGIFIGNGYSGYTGSTSLFTDDQELFNSLLISGDTDAKCERYFGGLWTTNIHGAGKVYQQKTDITKSGWYEIACKGFTTGSANLYASTTSGKTDNTDGLFPSSATSALISATAPSTYVQAALLLQDGGETYRQSVLVYIEVASGNATLEFGVEGTSGWACFDDFQLTYYGEDKQPYFYFNEANTDINELKNQTTVNKHTLYLQRNLKSNQWNSLVLPITMTAANVRTAFGQQTILSEFVGVDENNDYLINFKKVDLDNASNQLQAGKLYIIKPVGDMDKLANKTYTFDRIDNTKSKTTDGKTVEGTTSITVTASDDNPIIRVRNVAFESFNAEDGLQQNAVNVGEALESLYFKGSYIQKTETGLIPAGSFVLGASDGKWYHTTKAIDTIKGFRAWLDTSDLSEATLAKLSFSFNGVQDGGVTAIDGVEISKPATPFSQNVYDLNGRIVNTKGNVDGLAKGIYIVNGKKVVIK
ncbi:MAG: hypothetical protein ACI3YX_07935, partial [Prevotella sp.]